MNSSGLLRTISTSHGSHDNLFNAFLFSDFSKIGIQSEKLHRFRSREAQNYSKLAPVIVFASTRYRHRIDFAILKVNAAILERSNL